MQWTVCVHSEKKGAETAPLETFFYKTAPLLAKRCAVLQNSIPMHRGAFFLTPRGNFGTLVG